MANEDAGVDAQDNESDLRVRFDQSHSAIKRCLSIPGDHHLCRVPVEYCYIDIII